MPALRGDRGRLVSPLKDHQWDVVKWMLLRGHRAVDVVKVYGQFGLTTQAIYDRNSTDWKIPLRPGQRRGRKCPRCMLPRPPVQGKNHSKGMCEPCWNGTRPVRLTPEEARSRQHASAQRWREKNRVHTRAYSRTYSKAHPDKRAANADRNREKRREHNRWYRLSNLHKWREKSARYRARKLAATVEPVNYVAIFDRDLGICYLCGQDVPSDTPGYDHVIPLSKGGAHSMSNIRLVHRLCNLIKYARTPEQLGRVELMAAETLGGA